MTCPVCHKDGAPNPRILCPDCRAAFGLPERWPASRRLPRPCARCGCPQLIRALTRERGRGDWYSPSVAPFGVSFRRQTVVSPTGDGRALNQPDLGEPAGMLEVYVCRGCGFTEWYALEPEHVPIGAAYATELIDVDDDRRR
jgi:hypothetical protein